MQSFIDYSDEMFNWEESAFGYWQEGDTLYALSGGLSWGDDPTDAMRHLMIFNYLQVWALTWIILLQSSWTNAFGFLPML